MNKLDLTQLGGLKIKANDLDFANQGIINALEGLCNAFNTGDNPTYKLSGCVVTIAGGNASWTAGYMVKNGEVCYVPAGSIVWAGANTGICWVLTDLASGTLDPVIFNNGNENNIHRVRIGVLEVYVAQPLATLESAIQTIQQIIGAQAIAAIYGPWVALAPYLTNGWANAAGYPTYFRIIIDGQGNKIGFKGYLDGRAASESIINAGQALPANVRPTVTRTLQVLQNSTLSAGYGIAALQYQNSGILEIFGAAGGSLPDSETFVYLDGLEIAL